MATKNKKSTPKNNKPQKATVEEKKAPLIAGNKQVEVEPVATKSQPAAEKKTPTKSEPFKKTVKILWFNVKVSDIIAAVVTFFIGAVGFIASGLDLIDRIFPPASTSTPPYLLVIPPTAQAQTGGGGIYSSDSLPGDTPAPVAVPVQALTPLEFHGNEFTEKQVKCMAPTIIPLDGVSNAAFFPGGEALVLEMKGAQKIAIWDLQKNTSVKTMEGEYLAQSPFGPIFLREGYDAQYNAQIQVILAKDESILFGVPGELAYSIAISPDGKKLALGFADEVQLWDMTTSAKTVLLGGSAPFFSHDGNTIVSLGFGTVYLWDVNTGSLLKTLQQDGMKFTFSLDDRELYYLNGSSLYAWDVASGQTRTVLTTQETWSSYDNITINPSAYGKVLAVGSTFWKIPEQTFIRHLKEHGEALGYTVAGSFEGKRLVSISEANVIVWNLDCPAASQPTPAKSATYEKITSRNAANLRVARTYGYSEMDLGAFALDSDRFIANRRVYSLDSLQPVSSFEGFLRVENWQVAISPDGKYAAASHGDNQIALWDVDNSYILPALSGCFSDPVFDGENNLFSTNLAGEVCVWKSPYQTMQTFKLHEAMNPLKALSSRVYEVVDYYDGDSSQFALFDVLSGGSQPKYVFRNLLTEPSFSLDGKYFSAVSMDKMLFSIYHTSSQTLEKELSTAASSSFSHDGSLLAIVYYTDETDTIYIYNTSNWEIAAKLETEPGTANFHSSVFFSPDGHYLIVQDRNYNTVFWSVGGK